MVHHLCRWYTIYVDGAPCTIYIDGIRRCRYAIGGFNNTEIFSEIFGRQSEIFATEIFARKTEFSFRSVFNTSHFRRKNNRYFRWFFRRKFQLYLGAFFKKGAEVKLRVGGQVGAHWGALNMKKLCGRFNFFIESTGRPSTRPEKRVTKIWSCSRWFSWQKVSRSKIFYNQRALPS